MGGMDQGNHGILYVVFRATRDFGVTWSDKAWALVASAWQLVVLAVTGAIVFLSRKKGALFGAATLAIAFVLSYVHVWEHHYSATIVAALIVFLAFVEEDRRASPRVLVAAASVVLLVLPTPYALIEPHPDPAMWDATPAWGKFPPYVLPVVKVVPTGALFVLALRALLAAGLERPSWKLVVRGSQPQIGTQPLGNGFADPSR
jgi:hypothetical protein